jgi:hypothetical protein
VAGIGILYDSILLALEVLLMLLIITQLHIA